MARITRTVEIFRCERCGHEWTPRVAGKEPKVCPGCHSPYWNSPRRKVAPKKKSR